MTSIKVGNFCLDQAFNDPDELITKFARTLQKAGKTGNEFDTLVGTGISGTLVVPVLARAMGKDFIITRKPGDSHHHGSATAEGNWNSSGKWIFVDDGMGTGTTYRRTRKLVNKLAMDNHTPDLFDGAYLYGHDRLHGADFWTAQDIDRMGLGFEARYGDWSLDTQPSTSVIDRMTDQNYGNDPLDAVIDNGPGEWQFRDDAPVSPWSKIEDWSR